MALPMLVGGADCGPINPLQGLSKNFDQDRGIQQDQFTGRAGPSRETFRTQQPSRQIDNDAAKFFSTNRTGPASFDMSGLHATLPGHAFEESSSFQPAPSHPASAAWAMDFMNHQQVSVGTPIITKPMASVGTEIRSQSQPGGTFQSPSQGNGMFWGPQAYRPIQSPGMPAQMMMNSGISNQMSVQHDPSLWDQDFLMTASENHAHLLDKVQDSATPQPQSAAEADALSRTAGVLVDTLRDEQNPKFKNSEFMGLMRSLRDKTLIVEGNEIVSGGGTDWATQFIGGGGGDVKGKGRETDQTQIGASVSPQNLNVGGSNRFQDNPFVERLGEALFATPLDQNAAASSTAADVDEVYEYFRQDNEDYIRYQDERYNQPSPIVGSWDNNTAHWDKLQRDWDSFEATTTGIRPLSNYQFTQNNPYLLGERSGVTMNHARHSHEAYESVLELEAAVQRDPKNAQAWFALGVKQQDNEREPKAIEALRRSVELDPDYTPSWLALGISHTNESNRPGAYEAIREWVERHQRYGSLSTKLTASIANSSTQTERYDELINCLIAMARSDVDSDIDADIQVALAVLLNSNEEYAKATDCFMTALAVRPGDWVLYNRVGATLANNGSAEAALEYYYRALELNPMYIRARFNLGISCINLHRHEEAGRHILDALTLQESDTVDQDQPGRGGVTSAALWNCLRTVCIQMERMELAAMCETQDLDGLQQHFRS